MSLIIDDSILITYAHQAIVKSLALKLFIDGKLHSLHFTVSYQKSINESVLNYMNPPMTKSDILENHLVSMSEELKKEKSNGSRNIPKSLWVISNQRKIILKYLKVLQKHI